MFELASMLPAPLGNTLIRVVPRPQLLRLAGVFGAPRLSAAKFVQTCVLGDSEGLSVLEPSAPQALALGRLATAEVIRDFESDCADIPYRFTGIYPTDGVILWGLIHAFEPEVFIETGTGSAVSSQICLKALRRYAPRGRFVTIGESTSEVRQTARHNLAPYPEAEIIEGRAPADLVAVLDHLDDRSVGLFLDGPKGSSPEFWALLEAIFERLRPVFVGVHDCEAHLPRGFDPHGKWPRGRINSSRAQLVAFYEGRLSDDYDLAFMEDAWCEEHDIMNNIVYQSGHGLEPYVYKGSQQRSHSPYLGVLLLRACEISGQA